MTPSVHRILSHTLALATFACPLAAQSKVTCMGSGRFWHNDGGTTLLVSTKWQPDGVDFTRFYFEPTGNGRFQIKAHPTMKLMHTATTGDGLMTSRDLPAGPDTEYTLEPLGNDVYRIAVNGKYLHEDGGGDKMVSVRYQTTDAFSQFKIEPPPGGQAAAAPTPEPTPVRLFPETYGQPRGSHLPPTPTPTPVHDDEAPMIADEEWDVVPGQKAGVHVVVNHEVKGRYLHIDLDGTEVHGAKGGKLVSDTANDRAWYLSEVETRITPQDASFKLFKKPIYTMESDGSVTSSTERGASFGGEVSGDGPSLNADTSIAFTDTFTRNLKGFTPQAADTGVYDGGVPYAITVFKMSGCIDIDNGGLRAYTKPRDLIDMPEDQSKSFVRGLGGAFNGDAWTSYQLFGIPERAKSGLPIISQAIFLAPKGFKGKVPVIVDVKIKLQRVYSTGHTKFDSRWYMPEAKSFISQQFMMITF